MARWLTSGDEEGEVMLSPVSASKFKDTRRGGSHTVGMGEGPLRLLFLVKMLRTVKMTWGLLRPQVKCTEYCFNDQFSCPTSP